MSVRQSLKPNVAAAVLAAEAYDGVLSRRELRELGLDRHAVLHQVQEGRWVRRGHQTIALTRSPLSSRAKQWRALWEVGHRIAAIDGVSALQAAGLVNFDEEDVHVSIPHGPGPTWSTVSALIASGRASKARFLRRDCRGFARRWLRFGRPTGLGLIARRLSS